jgi:cytosine/adenosine deaminase-related metal-dependent hydrolase
LNSKRELMLPSIGGVCALVGGNLEPLFECEIKWKKNRIVSLTGKKEGKISDIEQVVVPTFVNSHTHLGDSIAKEAYVGLTLEEAVDPNVGLKTRILSRATKKEIIQVMRSTLKQCVSFGVTHVMDFREGGVEGLKIAKEACVGTGVDLMLLGRLSVPPTKDRVVENDGFTEAELEELYQVCENGHGIGVSGANEYSNRMLEQIKEVASDHKKLVAVHCLESSGTRNRLKHVFGEDEFQRCLRLRPNLYIHMTDATREEIIVASKKGKIVACPRSNLALSNGIPPLKEILESGGGLGTDNVMINAPDVFREMEFTYKLVTGLTKAPYNDVKGVLKAATVNTRSLLGLEPLQVNAKANFVVLDLKELKPFWNLYAVIVNRAQTENIQMVVKDGNILVKKI